MCAILDANVARGVFNKIGGAACYFMEEVERRKIEIVVGGQQLEREYEKAGMSRWLVEANRSGLVRFEDGDRIDGCATRLYHDERIRSDDWHILALALISGARLLYSSDRNLHADFTNKDLIDNPRGKVYSTSVDEDLAEKHRRLVRQSRC